MKNIITILSILLMVQTLQAQEKETNSAVSIKITAGVEKTV